MTTVTPDHEVLIIGAGFSGIGVAIALQRAGIEDVLIVEQGGDFGGTWYWNRYPGVAVDIPSFSYQFSFAQRSDWSRSYAPGQELRRYARAVAEEYGLRRRVRFGTAITGAVFDEDAHVWRVTTDTGDTLVARHVVDATGVLTIPKRPDIAGLEDFAGTVLHTARWDESADLRGKRVAVIGTGASAVQLIPAIAGQAGHVTVFQRTPIWCLPKLDVELSGGLRRALRLPLVGTAVRAVSQAYVEATFVIPAHLHKPLGLATLSEKHARRWLRSQVEDPEVREKLTPRYAVGCKRPSFHNTYLRTFNRDDVTLETDPIARITPEGIRTGEGTLHEVDVLVLATGFAVFEEGNLPKFPVAGRDGRDLGAHFQEGRLKSYEGVSVPGFPNWFTTFGPYGYNGSSYFNLVENQAAHITRCLEHARAQGATSVEVRPEAVERFFAQMLRRRHRQVFWQDSCASANSYYFTKDGDVPLRPSLTLETIRRARTFPLDDYVLRTTVPDATTVAAPQPARRG
jgi:cation diffusion facilitator CzcD-associated flavoprotein CzcO